MLGLRRWLPRLLAVLLIGGLLAMHGVTELPSGGAGPHAMAMGSNPAHDQSPGSGHTAAGHLATLCLAVLAATGLQLLARRSRPASVKASAWSPASTGRPPSTPRSARPPGPDRLALNVTRC